MAFLIGFNSVQLVPRTGAGFFATDLQGIENDGCNGSGCDSGFNQAPFTVPLVTNFTLVGCGDVACVGSGGGYGMMLRRGTGGYYVNGVIARFPRGGISLRDAETFARAGSVAVPDPATADLVIRNVYFVDVGTGIFQPGGGSTIQSSLDLAGNNLTSGTGAAGLFTAIPAQGVAATSVTSFDWSPSSSGIASTTGLSTFTGKLAAKGGSTFTGTSYVGAAAPGGAKWWSGWTAYSRD
jgi:hypothetical protein